MDFWKKRQCVMVNSDGVKSICRFAVESLDEPDSRVCRHSPSDRVGYKMVFKAGSGWSEDACSYREETND